MFWQLSIYRLMRPKDRYIWVQVRILHETDKAVLVDNGAKIWIPKSQMHKIRLKNNIFEIYVNESIIGQYLGLYPGCFTPEFPVYTTVQQSVAKPEDRNGETYMLYYMLKARILFKRNTDIELKLFNRIATSHGFRRSGAAVGWT